MDSQLWSRENGTICRATKCRDSEQHCCQFASSSRHKPKFHYGDFPVTTATSPRQTRDVPFSPNSITPTSPKLPRAGKFRGSRRNEIWAKGDVTGLSQTSPGSRHSGIWSRQVMMLRGLQRRRPWRRKDVLAAKINNSQLIIPVEVGRAQFACLAIICPVKSTAARHGEHQAGGAWWLLLPLTRLQTLLNGN